MRYALVKSGFVDNVVEANEQPVGWVAAGDAAPGWLVAGDGFAPPAPARLISNLAFLSRFTESEAVAIDLASIGATASAAGMRRYLQLVNAAKHIDLDMGETRDGVVALEAAGILADGRAAVVLDAPIRQSELP
ncbi:MAG: hypothetical protein JWP29_4709 [Rhodoferax sp.]|nr:hypothetical protein [Rhodoferax sp.]